MTVKRIALLTLLSVGSWASSVQAHVLGGGGNPASDCYVTFEGIESESSTVECTDGGFCDADGLPNGMCTFPVSVCVFDTDVPGCTPAPVTKLKASKLLPLLPAVGATAPACGETNNVVVGLKKGGTKKGKKKIKVSAKTDTGNPKKDKDKVSLVCNPSTGGPVPGDRDFSIVWDPALLDPAGSHFFTSALNGQPVEGGPDPAHVMEGSIFLRAGTPDPATGVATLEIAQDSIIHFKDIGNGSECVRFLAAGSEGKIDCDGGTPVGTKMTEDSMGLSPSGPNTSTFEQGAPGRPGDGYVRTMVVAVTCEGVLGIPGACPGGLPNTVEDCSEPGRVDYSKGFVFNLALTTGEAIAEVPNSRQGGTASLTKVGEPFDCQSFTGSNGPGILVTPFILPDVTFGGVTFDTANLMYLDDTR